MADDDERVTEEERKRRALLLSQQVADKYSPDKLSKIVVDQAGRGDRLDLATRMEMERKLGGNFADVRVFRGPFAEDITRQHRADAVTVGSTGMILVREGPRSDPSTALGKALLAHELTHVRQAQGGMHFALEHGASQAAPHEQEAEAAERAVHAEASGKGGQGGGGKGNEKELKQKVRKRVLEMIAEHERLRLERNGLD